MRRLGIDLGSKRIGLAIAESDVLAIPWKTITLKTSGIRNIVDILCGTLQSAEGFDELIVGLPLRLDGTEGEAAMRSRIIVDELRKRIAIPVVTWDERFSSASAHRNLQVLGLSERRRRPIVDQSAATLLLQSYLDAKMQSSWPVDHSPALDLPVIPHPRGRREGQNVNRRAASKRRR